MRKAAAIVGVVAAVGAIISAALAPQPAPCFVRNARGVQTEVSACVVTGECASKKAPIECGPDAGVMLGLP